MVQPPGYEQSDPSLVCKLNKAPYGFKQAPRAWFQKLQTYLLELGFTSAKCDVSLFTKFNGGETTLVLVYVDDIIITGSSSEAISKLISSLNAKFPLKDLGELNLFLGIQVQKSSNGSITPIPSAEQTADTLTKPLPHNLF